MNRPAQLRTYPRANGNVTTTWNPRPVRSLANAIAQRHNCPDCWDDCERRGCERCEGTGEVRGIRAPVDALLPVQLAGTSRFGNTYVLLSSGPMWKERQQQSLRPSPAFRRHVLAEIEIDVERCIPALSPETVAWFRRHAA